MGKSLVETIYLGDRLSCYCPCSGDTIPRTRRARIERRPVAKTKVPNIPRRHNLYNNFRTALVISHENF